ncbi:MAG: hypothetical protein ABIJ56_07050 [Pseudomonadota bacterium]
MIDPGKNKASDEKIDAIKKLSFHVAHRLRNPLAALMNVTYQIKKQLQPSDASRELIFMLEEEIYHMKIISDELALLAGCGAADTCLIKASELLAQFCTSFGRECTLVDDEVIETLIEGDDVSLEADPQFLFSMLKIVIFNILIRTDERQKVRISAGREGETLILSIQCAGKHDFAFREDALQDMLESPKESRVFSLSLAIIEYCLKADGGSMSMEESPAGSTKITLRLPLHV